MRLEPDARTSGTAPAIHGRARPAPSRRATLVEAQRVPRKARHGVRRCDSLGIKESPGALEGQARALHIDAIPRDMSYNSSIIWGGNWAAGNGLAGMGSWPCGGEGVAAGRLGAMLWHCIDVARAPSTAKIRPGLSGGGGRYPIIGAVHWGLPLLTSMPTTNGVPPSICQLEARTLGPDGHFSRTYLYST